MCQRSSLVEMSQQDSLSLTVHGCDNNEGCGERTGRNVSGEPFRVVLACQFPSKFLM